MQAQDGFNFALEDTTDKCYRDIAAQLTLSGWNRVSYKKRSKLERKRFPVREQPHAIWTLNEKDVDFTDLDADQVCNHFEGITALTTKRGFCDLLRDMHWDSEAADTISPRSYNLGDPIHREEFIDDFRLVAATNIIRWYLLHNAHTGIACMCCASSAAVIGVNAGAGKSKSKWTPPTPQVSNTLSSTYSAAQALQYVQQAVTACLWHIRVHLYGEWPGVDISRYFKDREAALEENQWCSLLDFSYAVAELPCPVTLEDIHSCADLTCYGCSNQENSVQVTGTAEAAVGGFHPYLFKLKAILRCMGTIHRQYAQIDGYRNIWVVKAPDSSCGIGIKVLSRLVDVLQCEKGMGGRTVQKYVEFPLLAPPKDTASDAGTLKFDLRVWVLVTSFLPLQAHIYSQLYGRRCGTAYTTDLSTLSDNYTHLTNYSVQKKQKFSQQARNSGAVESDDDPEETTANDLPPVPAPTFDSHAAGKLRSVIRHYRSSGTSGRSTMSAEGEAGRQGSAKEGSGKARLAESDLLMGHEHIAQVVRRRNIEMQKEASKLRNTQSTQCFGPCAAVRQIGAVQDVWADYVWPEVKRKIAATLQAANREVTHRERSFEFLGYDVIIDAQLEPWILEVNMSPAMAHRTPAQSALIASMCEGLLDLAVFPHFPGGGKPDRHPDASGDSNRKVGCWESLVCTPASAAPDGGDEQNQPENMAAVENVPVNDWDEIAPPDSQTRPPKGGALHRKFSGIGSNRGAPPPPVAERRGSASTSNTNSNATDPYFQKFINAAAAAGSALLSTAINKSSGMYGKDAGRGSGVSSLIATGTAISAAAIEARDTACCKLDKLRSLQSWWRVKAAKLRKYHHQRDAAATLVQCQWRMYMAAQRADQLRRLRSAVVLQCCVRRWQARVALWRRKQYVAAVRLQKTVRGRLGRRKFARHRVEVMARRIQRWASGRMQRRKIRAATKVVLFVRKWLARRRRIARRNRANSNAISLCEKSRSNRLRRIFGWWRKEQLSREEYRVCNRKILSRCAAEKAQRKRTQREDAHDAVQQKREEVLMGREELLVLQHVAFLDTVDFVQEVVEDAFDVAWHTIRKLHLARRKMHKLGTTAPPNQTVTAAPAAGREKTDVAPLTLTAAATRRSSRMQHIGVVEEELSIELPALSPAKTETKILSEEPKIVVPNEAAGRDRKDDFQFTADKLLEQVIAQTEVDFRQRGPTAPETTAPAAGARRPRAALVDTATAPTPTQPPTQRTGPPQQRQQDSAGLFSPESRKLLDYMDSITFTDITSQPPQPHLASLDSLSRLTSSVVSQDPVLMAAPSVQPAADGGISTGTTAPAEAPPSPATSSPKVIISHRRSRQRPNVEYVGQYPVSTINATTATPTSETISAAGHNTTFTAVPHVHAIHSSDTATDLDAAIEQASYLNIQSILSRRPSDLAPTAMMAQEDPRLMAHLRPALAAARGSASAASLQSEWEMELTHTDIRRGGEHMQFAMDADALLNPPLPSHTPHAEYPHTDRYYAQHDPYNSGPHPPEYLRRSFDPKSAASRQPRKHQMNDKNWFSYDEGTARSGGGGGAKNKGNEMWSLFLKQKREAQMPDPDTLLQPQPQHNTRKVRPQSSDGVRRQASPVRPHSHTTTAGPPHYEQSRTPRDYASTLRQWPVHVGDGRDGSPTRRKEWSFDEPHRHYEPKQRPTSAGGRIRVSAQPPQQSVEMAAGAVRPSLSDALAEALQGLAAAENGFNDVQMPVQRVEEHQAVEPATSARRVHRDKKDSGRSHSRRQHREVKERLTATYMLG